ncbi:MAG: LysR substrate-binding domain-containing protein [Bosea sp. (in: a-proteobacteria)]|uniref:LysR substrate-binding domain-containing protein n=1 Tax=Bosea sp. (in: a-proteobacteria) TaxID=1871050 RepID=UPI0027355640|nr:LysR substrate-binding domain-containing protein [Bosea sp. (in: a-proteobacteria)]MDP3600544.1 LysR substrate-binding domain-containing protein [Bosea sp. (in: a-proteobacteria)]
MAQPRLPLNALRAFEAAARLSSMSAAAAELGVTHGAISRHVRSLEADLGVPLLKRLSKSVEPTAQGGQLASTLREAFARMQQGVAALAPLPLTLSCSATISMHWLIPRLGEFKRANPDVEVRLNLNYGEVDFLRDEISLAIRSSMFKAPQEVTIRPLLRERIGPVCHPDFAARAGLQRLEDLVSARLLGTATRRNAWREWMEACGWEAGLLVPQEVYDHFYLQNQAAACGLGVAIAPEILVEGEIRRGHLVAPFGFVDGPHELNLWISPHLRHRSDVQRLADWIERSMRM